MLTAYMDESYNNRTLCVAGWLSSEEGWERTESQWAERIQYERRISLKKGQVPISRYHASDCANRRGEFEGWTKERLTRFSKRLTEIIGRNKPVGIVVGASLDDFEARFQSEGLGREWSCYAGCIMQNFLWIGEIMERSFPEERVTIVHDRGKLSATAVKIFNLMLADTKYQNRKYLATIDRRGWEDCVALQPADLLAYEGYKLVDARLRGNLDLRRSLQRILGKNVTVVAQYLSSERFRTLSRRMKEMKDESDW